MKVAARPLGHDGKRLAVAWSKSSLAQVIDLIMSSIPLKCKYLDFIHHFVL